MHARSLTDRDQLTSYLHHLNQACRYSLSMSLKLIPDAGHATSTTLESKLAPSAPVYDQMRHGITSTASEINTRHPLQSRLENWQQTQYQLRLNLMRQLYGPGEPIRRGMELHCCNDGVRHTGFGIEKGIGADILMGTDTKIDFEDVFTGREEHMSGRFIEYMEKRVGC